MASRREAATAEDHGGVAAAAPVVADPVAPVVEPFRSRHRAGSIDRKLALVRDVHAALYDGAVATRAEWLEASIVLLIVLEIVLAFVIA